MLGVDVCRKNSFWGGKGVYIVEDATSECSPFVMNGKRNDTTILMTQPNE